MALPSAFAQTAPAESAGGAAAPKLLDKVTVEGASAAPWDRPAPTASRLGLSGRETPAAVTTLTQEQIQARGLRGSVEALNAAPGVLAGQLPSSPGMASMRRR